MEKKATIQYLLNEEGRKQSLLNGGNGEMIQDIIVDLTDEIASMIEKSIFGSLEWDAALYVGFGGYDDLGEIESTPSRCVGYNEEYRGFEYKYELRYFDISMTAEQLIDWERDRLKTVKKDEENIMSEIKVGEEQWKEKFNLEKEKWINQYGTPRLKSMYANDNNIYEVYLEERIKNELPGFEFITYEYLHECLINYNEQYKTSNEVVEEANSLKKLGFEVNYGIVGKNFWYSKIPCVETKITEVIYIKNYLDKFFIVKKFY